MGGAEDGEVKRREIGDWVHWEEKREIESCRLLPVAAIAADEGESEDEDEDEEEGR